MEPIQNKIAQSGLITLDLEDLQPKDSDIIAFDLKPFLFKELILKEKDFREAIKNWDWQQYQGKNVAVFCSADAIIPGWAYMLVSVNLAPYTSRIFTGTPTEVKEKIWLNAIEHADLSAYQDGKIILKGCGTKPVPEAAYFAMSRRLLPIVKSLMYGEPCSTVPVYKKKKKD